MQGARRATVRVQQAAGNAAMRPPGVSHIGKLCSTRFEDGGAQALAEGLKKNSSLQSLNLSKVTFDTAGVEALAKALKKNKALKSLDLSRNNFVSDGPAALANALNLTGALHEDIFRGKRNIAEDLLNWTISEGDKERIAVRIEPVKYTGSRCQGWFWRQ